MAIIIIDSGIEGEEWVKPLIEKCLNFYHKAAKNISVIMVKNKMPNDGKIGLTIEDIDGFIIYWQNMVRISKKYTNDGVNANATLAWLVVDTCFHEMHHCQSYHEDYEWTISHRDEEEENANEVAKDLCVEFFKTISIDVPIGNTPYWYKTNNEVLTNLREYFNILLDSENKWPDINVKTPSPSPVPTSLTPHTSFDGIIDPLANITPAAQVEPTIATTHLTQITAQKAQQLYLKCFEKIFDGCCPTANGFNSPEKIFEPIPVSDVVVSASTMSTDGIVREQNVQGQLSGIIFKTSKLPAYDFTLSDGKQRRIIPQNPQKRNSSGHFTSGALRAQAGEKIGYIIDKTSNKFLLRYENGTLTPC